MAYSEYNMLGFVYVRSFSTNKGDDQCHQDGEMIFVLFYLFFLDLALFFDPQQNLSHVRLQDHPAHHQLVEDVMNLKIKSIFSQLVI